MADKKKKKSCHSFLDSLCAFMQVHSLFRPTYMVTRKQKEFTELHREIKKDDQKETIIYSIKWKKTSKESPQWKVGEIPNTSLHTKKLYSHKWRHKNACLSIDIISGYKYLSVEAWLLTGFSFNKCDKAKKSSFQVLSCCASSDRHPMQSK